MANRNKSRGPSRVAARNGALARLAAHGLLVCTASCLPSHADFLRIPVAFDAPPTGGELTVTASCMAIRKLMPEFDPSTAAFYARGRAALPFREDDTDGDGITDAITVTFPSLANEEAWLIIVCPGVRATGELPDPSDSRRVRLDFTKWRR